jgi:hypothetical protein
MSAQCSERRRVSVSRFGSGQKKELGRDGAHWWATCQDDPDGNKPARLALMKLRGDRMCNRLGCILLAISAYRIDGSGLAGIRRNC